MLRIGIIGATGYAGEELIKLLIKHPEARIASLTAKVDRTEDIVKLFPYLSGKISMECKNLDIEEVKDKCDLIFLALPHRVSMEVAPKFLEANKRIVDLSADYRLKDASLYEKWYQIKHRSPQYINEAIYGLPELYRKAIKKARIVANPGCYPTGIILSLAPLLKTNLIYTDWIITDSKSGVTGAGRWTPTAQEFNQGSRNLKAYKINQHQHIPEIEQELSKIAKKKIKIIFVPHVVPMERGILNTIYVRLKATNSTAKELLKIYSNFYKDEPFVEISEEDKFPEIRDVQNTNVCRIGLRLDEERNLAVIISCLDNLLKGASGQAVQNMNIMCGFQETLGLK